MLSFERSSDFFIISTFVTIFTCFYACYLVLMELKVKLLTLSFKVRIKFQKYSVAKFYLSCYKSVWFIALLMLIIQCIIRVLVIKTWDKKIDRNLLTYSFLCPDDSLECTNLSLITYLGLLVYRIILIVFLLPNFLDVALLVYESIIILIHKAIFVDIILMRRLGFLMIVSFIYLHSSSVYDISIVKDTVIILFLNKMNEGWYCTIQIITPRWIYTVEYDISNFKIEEKNVPTFLTERRRCLQH